ncbi:MAG: hypothetical protein ABIM89_05850 [Mycobacteriales bacterium]
MITSATPEFIAAEVAYRTERLTHPRVVRRHRTLREVLGLAHGRTAS